MYKPTEDIVNFIASYMNESHGDALREIAAAHGVRADSVEIIDMTAAELIMLVRAEGGERTVGISWPSPLQRREDIRLYLEEMQEDASYRSS